MCAEDNSSQVCVEFIGEFREKFETLKKYYEIQNDAELVRVLVNEKARQLNVGPLEVATNGSR